MAIILPPQPLRLCLQHYELCYDSIVKKQRVDITYVPVIIGLFVVAAIVFLSISWSYGSINGMFLHFQKFPGHDNPRIAQPRALALAKLDKLYREVTSVKSPNAIFATGMKIIDSCSKGRHNWKNNDSIAYSCGLRAQAYVGFTTPHCEASDLLLKNKNLTYTTANSCLASYDHLGVIKSTESDKMHLALYIADTSYVLNNKFATTEYNVACSGYCQIISEVDLRNALKKLPPNVLSVARVELNSYTYYAE